MLTFLLLAFILLVKLFFQGSTKSKVSTTETSLKSNKNPKKTFISETLEELKKDKDKKD